MASTRVTLVLALVATVALPASSGAQDRITARVSDGDAPAADVDVLAIVNGIKQPVGRTTAEGEVQVDLDRVGLSKGTDVDGDGAVSVDVWVKACIDDRIELILAVEGEERGECVDEDAEIGEGCGCRKLGAFVPIPGGRLIVNLAPGAPNPVRQEPPPAGDGHWAFGVGVDYRHFGNWDQVACDRNPGFDRCETDSHGSSFGGFVEYGPPGLPLDLGIDLSYGWAPDVDVAGPGFEGTGSTDFFEASPYVGVPWKWGDTWFRGTLGSSWLYNMIEYDLAGVGLPGGDLSREQDNWNPFARIEAGRRIAPNWGVRGFAGYSSNFSGNDADSNQFLLGVRLVRIVGFRPLLR